MTNKTHINRLLMEQFGVLARIDTNSGLLLKKTFLKSTLDKKITENRLKALEMSKKMAYTCYIIMKYLNNEESLDNTLKVLKDCLETNYGHIYSVSASCNLDQIYNILIQENTEHSP